MKQKKKILAYLFGSLGDSIVAIPALRAARRQFPNAEIVLLQNFLTADLVKASQVIPDELVDRNLSYNSGLGRAGKLSNFYRLWRTIRDERFDAAVYLVISQRPKKAVLRDRLFFRSCGITKLYGFRAFSDRELYPRTEDRRPAMTEHEAVRKLRRLESDGIEFRPDEDLRIPFFYFSRAELDRIDRWLEAHIRQPDALLIGMAPGCKTKTNAWPLARFIELGNRVMAETNCEIIIVGGPGEQEAGEQIIAAWGKGVNSAGKFSVRESGALLSKCDLYIGLDTGTTHLAASSGTKCLGIYGERNNPGHWFPFGEGHTVLFHPVECAGCGLQECPVSSHPCMNGISVDAVWQNLRPLLKRDAEAAPTKAVNV